MDKYEELLNKLKRLGVTGLAISGNLQAAKNMVAKARGHGHAPRAVFHHPELSGYYWEAAARDARKMRKVGFVRIPVGRRR